MTGEATDFDGRGAALHRGHATVEPGGVRFGGASGRPALFWRFDEIRRVRPYHPPEHLALRRDDVTGERLVIIDPATITAFKRALPRAGVTARSRRRFARRWGAILGTIAAAVLVLWLGVPWTASAIAALLPHSLKETAGARVLATLETSFARCADEAGQAALDALVTRLAGHAGLSHPVRTTALRIPEPNAFALPGNHIVVTSGLLHHLKAAEALAGILAHEIGHHAHDHPTESFIRRGLISTLVGAITGAGQFGWGTDGLAGLPLLLSYSRETEREADAFGLALMNDAGIDARPLTDFFDRLDRGDGASWIEAWLSTHPADADRRRFVARAATARGAAMPAADWAAIRAMCPKPGEKTEKR